MNWFNFKNILKIHEKGKCIDDCSHDEIYNYTFEYHNICFSTCPPNTHILSSNKLRCEDDLICQIYNYNQTGCLTEIPEGYFCNSTEFKTIDKCHENCKTCNKSPTEYNNNCETCKDDGPIYFDLGNCREICEHNSFLDTDSILKCKCTKNISCKYCTEESNELNLCLSCNSEEGYYPKIDDEIRVDGFINCYKNPEEYFLKNEKYEKCYTSCKYCTELGTELNNKCDECKSGYSFIINNNNIKNCYEECPKYYFDSKNYYHCIDNCPEGYKLINSTNKCIDKCANDNIYNYKFEYNNVCYKNCPNNTIKLNNNLCISSKKDKCPEDFP